MSHHLQPSVQCSKKEKKGGSGVLFATGCHGRIVSVIKPETVILCAPPTTAAIVQSFKPVASDGNKTQSETHNIFLTQQSTDQNSR